MPEVAQIRIEGLDKLQAAITQIPNEVQSGLRAAMKGSTELVRSGVATYPPETEANRPPGINGRWYVRGFGTRTVTGQEYATSEVLGRSWGTDIQGFGASIKGIVGTRASYAPWVQDEEQQAPFHRRRGWPTVEGVLEEKGPKIQRLFEQIIAKILARLGK